MAAAPTSSYEISESALPDNVFVHCPKTHGFAQVRVKSACRGCPFFGGLIDVDQTSPRARFEDRYRVSCSHPTARRMSVVQLD